MCKTNDGLVWFYIVSQSNRKLTFTKKEGIAVVLGTLLERGRRSGTGRGKGKEGGKG